MGFLTIFYKYMIQQYFTLSPHLIYCFLAIFKTNKISNAGILALLVFDGLTHFNPFSFLSSFPGDF